MLYKPIKPDISKYFKEKKELGNKGLMMIDIDDPLQVLYHLMSAAEYFSLCSMIDYEKISSFTDEIYKRVFDLYKYLLENDVGEVFFVVGAEFAGHPLVSSDKFNEMVTKYVKGITDLVRIYGKKSIVHYHGNLFKVLEGMKLIKPDELHTIEAPPIGDCTIKQARDVLGKDMILIGNMQYDDIVHREKDEIEEMVKNVIDEGKSGKFILSPSVGPYDEEIAEKTVDNYIAFIEAGVKYGKLYLLLD